MRRDARGVADPALPREQQGVADLGQTRVGMAAEAVLIAWNFRGVTGKDGFACLDRFLDRDITAGRRVGAGLVFRGGRLASYRSLAMPYGSTVIAPQPLMR